MYKGIDVSDCQGSISWQKVKAAGVKFAILRSVRGSGKTDYQFADNVSGCRENAIPFDVYKYSYANTGQKAVTEAQQVVALLKQHNIDCTVWWDMEDPSLRCLGKQGLTVLINKAKTVIESAGYTFGIYCNKDWYRNVLDTKAFTCPFWVAGYPVDNKMELAKNPPIAKKPVIAQELFGWQYSSKGSVAGIVGNVDLNIIYADIEKEDSSTVPSVPTVSNPYAEPTYTLYRGRLRQSKEYVKWLQGNLKVKEDGIFGKDTDRALREYQRAYGLVFDGKCGKKTIAEMKK